MRALLRIATPASVAVALTACTHDLDDYYRSAKTDAALATNGDAANYEDGAVFEADSDSGAADSDSGAADSDGDAADSSQDACVCLHELKGECKQWSPPNCGR